MNAPPRTADGCLIWIAGTCPACGSTATLFVGSGGHVTCSLIPCPDPCKADRMLHGEEVR